MSSKMAESSDSEEFYDAEEFTPIKGSKYVNNFYIVFLNLQIIPIPFNVNTNKRT